MAAAEVRTLWQRTANRCFVQEDAKRAPKLACRQSSSATSKLVDAGPANTADESDCTAVNATHFNSKSSFCHPSSDPRWWLHSQPNYGYQKGVTNEKLSALEEEVETLIAGDEIKASSKNSLAFPELMDVMAKHETVEIDSIACSVTSKQTNDFSSEPDYSWIESDKAEPWWRMTDKDELASFVSHKSLNHIENCDLPPPKKKHLSGYPSSIINNHSTKSRSFPSSTAHTQGNLDSGLVHRKQGIAANEGLLYFASDKSSSLDLQLGCTQMLEDVKQSQQISEGDTSKAQLLEALCHSQTRAREAEEAAKQAYAEREHIVTLIFTNMMSKSFLKPQPHLLLPFPTKPFFPYTLKYKPSFIPINTFSTTTIPTLSYGPSLHKGTNPFPLSSQSQPPQNDAVLNQQTFTRIFNLAALRVPSSNCSALENRLRGHLLNWPRIRNIARVPGDEIDPNIASLLGQKSEENDEEGDGDDDALSPVLYRDKLAKTFNTRGFVKFRNLAKISRPNRNNKKKEKGKIGEAEGNKRVGRNGFVEVEVVEEGVDEGLRNLIGEEIGSGKWRGSTRLLLLDERYKDCCVDELPEAIKAVLKEYAEKSSPLTFELVRCKLTLFYDYWQTNEILEALLPEGMIVPTTFETVGHIAHLNLREEHLPYKKLIAKVVLDKNKPKIQTVANKIDSIHNEYRTMQLEVLAGNHSLVTTLAENGLRFHVDLAIVYWNSRLGTERQRLLSGFTRNDVVCDVFAGVGPLAISAAKIVKRVFANDLNPHAVEYLERNSVLNKLEKKIKVFKMDGRRFIKAMFASDKAHSITQVVMNLPNDAAEFLDAFRGIYKDRPKDGEFTYPMIHVYGFSKAEDPEFDFHKRIRIALLEVAVNVDMRRVRLVAPGKWMLCASFILPKSVAFANTAVDT